MALQCKWLPKDCTRTAWILSSCLESNAHISSGLSLYRYGIDFILDNDLDVWYIESQDAPAFGEEFGFRVALHQELLQSTIDIVDEIQRKQETNPTSSILPLKNQGGWDVVYAGDGKEDWMYQYEGYHRSKNKKECMEYKEPASLPSMPLRRRLVS